MKEGEVGGAVDKAILRALIPLGLALGGIGALETLQGSGLAASIRHEGDSY